MYVNDNYKEVEERVKAACARAGRDRSEVTLIAVSKTKPSEMIASLYEDGVRYFGENKVQEMTEKYEILPKDIKWQLIGHLQTNKVKYIVDKADMIHSVDSVKLAAEIEKEAVKKGVEVDILIEVNVAQEETKFGLCLEEVLPLIKEIAKFEHVHIRGLMTIAPYVENPEENRKHFASLAKLAVDIASERVDNVSMSVLSMGMTNDYEVAIEEGATMVRVGTAIFGERYYAQH